MQGNDFNWLTRIIEWNIRKYINIHEGCSVPPIFHHKSYNLKLPYNRLFTNNNGSEDKNDICQSSTHMKKCI